MTPARGQEGGTSGWRWIRNAGWALITTPTIMFCLMIYAAVLEPRLLLEQWEFYLLFIGLPYAAGFWLLWWAARHRPKTGA